MRRTYVYALDIEYPGEANLDRLRAMYCTEDPDTEPHWPRERKFLSQGAAERRAALLREAGAIVTILRSEPIQFNPSPQEFAARRRENIVAGLREMIEDLS